MTQPPYLLKKVLKQKPLKSRTKLKFERSFNVLIIILKGIWRKTEEIIKHRSK